MKTSRARSRMRPARPDQPSLPHRGPNDPGGLDYLMLLQISIGHRYEFPTLHYLRLADDGRSDDDGKAASETSP